MAAPNVGVGCCGGLGDLCQGSIDAIAPNRCRSSEEPHPQRRNCNQKSREDYRKWLGTKIVERQLRNDRQMALGAVSPYIRSLPGHHMQTRTETTNQTYGKYIDLIPEYPAEYPLPSVIGMPCNKLLVKFRDASSPCIEEDSPFIPRLRERIQVEMHRRDNFSDGYRVLCLRYGGMPPLESSAGCISTGEPLVLEENVPILAEKLAQRLGQRRHGFTVPVMARTGLELNRPVYQYSSVLDKERCWTR